MNISPLEDLQKRKGRNYAVKVLIEDDNNEWVDFSDRVTQNQDKILKIPTIKNNIEARFLSAKYTSSAGTLEVDNSDDFWDQPLSITLKTLDGNTASFVTTYKTSETVWTGRRIQFRLIEFFEDVPREEYLGTFLIDDIATTLTGRASLRLSGLEKPLQERDASTVKAGRNWYQNRTVPFLVKQLVAVEYGDRNSGDLPTSFNISESVGLPTSDGSLTLSTLGKPPQNVDTDGDDRADTYYDKNYRIKAMCMAPSTLGSRASFTSADTLYLGCDDLIYQYNTSNDYYTEVLSSGEFGTGYKIRHMWYWPVGADGPGNPVDPDHAMGQYIVGIAYPDYETDRTAASDFQDWAGVSATIFKLEYDGTTATATILTTISNFHDGRYIYMSGDTNAPGFNPAGAQAGGPGPFHYARIIGRVLNRAQIESLGWNLFVNHRQVLRALNVGSKRAGSFAPLSDFQDGIGFSSLLLAIGEDDLTLPYSQGEDGDCASFYNFYVSDNITDTPPDEIGLRISWGQQGCVAFSAEVGAHTTQTPAYKQGVIIFGVAATSTYGDIDMQYYDLALDAVGTLKEDNLEVINDDESVYTYPIASCIDNNGNFYISYYGINEDSTTLGIDAPENISKIYKWIPANGGTLTTPYSREDYFNVVPLELAWDNSISQSAAGSDYTKLLAVCMNATAFNPFTTLTDNDALYTIRQVIASDDSTMSSGADATIMGAYSNQPKGITVASNGDFYFVAQGSGFMSQYDLSEDTLSVIDEGFPVVEDNLFLESNLAIDTTTRVGETMLWGCATNNFDDQLTPDSSAGSYLFKLDNRITDHVFLADFDGLSIYDALGLLAQRSNCVHGFDEKGDYFFRRRSVSSTADFIIDADSGDEINITKKRGRDQIFNYVEITPFVSEFQEPSYKAFMQKRGSTEEEDMPADQDIRLKQLDSKTKKITLICVADGDAVIDGVADSVKRNKSGYPRFKYAIYEAIVTGRFSQDHTSANTVYAHSVFGGSDTDFGIRAGYYLMYTDSDENTSYYRIVSVDNNTNSFVLAAGLTITSKTNEEFKVLRRSGTSASTSVTWSDEGAAYGASTSPSAFNYVIVASAMNLSVDTVVFIKGKYLRITSITEGTTTDTVYLDDTVILDYNEAIPAYFAPSIASKGYEIGNTEVYLTFDPPSGVKNVFKEGDRIEIDCPGYKLAADEASKQVALNTASIEKHRKRQYPQIRNRFFTRKLAKQFADKLRTENAFPRYRFEVEMPLSNYLKILTSVSASVEPGGWLLSNVQLRSKKLLSYRPGYQEDCRIASIEHNPQQGRTKLILIAENFY